MHINGNYAGYLEKIMVYIFAISVVCSIFAPAIHYIGFALLLLISLYVKLIHNDILPLYSMPVNIDKVILILLIVFFLWSAFFNIFAAADFYTWGKGASVYLEMLLWYLVAVKILDSSATRRKYIDVLVLGTTIIFCLILCISGFDIFLPFRRLKMNLNTLGLYATLALPYLFYYSLWVLHDRVVLKYMICIICLLVSIISFSSGAWLAIGVMLPIIACFAFLMQKLSMKSILSCLCLCLIALLVINTMTDGILLKRLNVEISQITSLNDMDSLTNHRYSIWRGTVKMILNRPLSGYGRDSFDAEHARLLSQDAELAKATGVFDHAHNMYLELAFAGGMPSSIIFIIFVFILLKKCWNNRNMVENGIPWYMLHFTLLVGMVVYGLTGDVFEARRDLAVIFWTALGIISVMPAKVETND